MEMRKELGIGENEFVVIFVGHFIERKGPQRVDDAVKDIPGITTLFIGQGDFKPNSNCAFCGPVPHERLAKYLSAADVFVLPTLAEGCCNAILEAVCCGVPVISSNLCFNDDILDDSYSIRVDPMNVNSLS